MGSAVDALETPRASHRSTVKRGEGKQIWIVESSENPHLKNWSDEEGCHVKLIWPEGTMLFIIIGEKSCLCEVKTAEYSISLKDSDEVECATVSINKAFPRQKVFSASEFMMNLSSLPN